MDPTLVETHSAVLALVGEFAYKVKKPVRLPFLDFSTVAARWAVAEREVALNRRLAPDVYLGVGTWHPPAAADAPGGARPAGAAGDGEPVIVMRRMPADRRLTSLVATAEREELHDIVRAVARVIASFHARADRSPTIDAAGHPATIATKFATDVAETRDLAPGVLDDDVIERIDRLGHSYLRGRVPLLEQRVRDGLVVDGHGDLLADDIFSLPDGPRILDCIEFDDRLRWGDVLADVAFLAMDLERLDAGDLAAQLLTDYAEFSDEHHPPSLAHYYIATRALIRAKVSALRVHQGDRLATMPAQRLLGLAADHLQRGRVTCSLVGGGPGTGKSSVAEALAPHLDAVVLSSDEIRKELAGLPHDADAATDYGAGIYDTAHTAATYTELLVRARRLLEHGTSVVLDASWSREEHREAARAVATATASGIRELRCEAPPRVTHARISARRASGHHVSDATIAVADAMAVTTDPWPSATTLDTDAPLFVVTAAARRAVS